VRVLFLSTSMSMGGADQQLLSAAREMRSLRPATCSSCPSPRWARWAGSAKPRHSHRVPHMPRGIPDPRGSCGWFGSSSMAADVVTSHMVHANLMPGRCDCWHLCRPGVDHPQYLRGRSALDVRVSADQRPGRPHDIICEAAAERLSATGFVPRELLTVVPNGVERGPFRTCLPARGSLRRSLG